MSESIGMAREGSHAGWPFWASVLTHIVGLGAVSAVAVTSASTPPPPVPIELVRLEQPAPPEVPKPKVVKAPSMKPILHQPTTASAPVSSAPHRCSTTRLRPRRPRRCRTPSRPIAASSPPPRRAFRARATGSPPAPARCSKPAIFPWPGAARAGAAAGTAPVRRSRRRAARPVSPNLRDRSAAIRRRRAIPSRRAARASRASRPCASSCSRPAASARSPSHAPPDMSISIVPRWEP